MGFETIKIPIFFDTAKQKIFSNSIALLQSRDKDENDSFKMRTFSILLHHFQSCL